MDFKYGCFLSYRHGKKGQEMMTLVENIRDALVGKLEMSLDIQEVFQDKDDIGAGDWVRETISSGMCHSVVMILIYTNKYFSQTRLFCASELEGMIRLESQRAKISAIKPKPSIVIPILLNGKISDLPTDLQKRNPVDFTGLSLEPGTLYTPDNQKKIRDIAEKVYELMTQMNNTGKTFCDDCGDFLILDETSPADRQKIETFVLDYKAGEAAVWRPEFAIS